MRPTLVLVAAAATLLAGCLGGTGEDPFAYTRKALYFGSFDLSRTPPEGDSQAFRVDDGSIGRIRIQAWVNATEGGGLIVVTDPGGRVVAATRDSDSQLHPLELGVWTVRIEADAHSKGSAQLLATRG